MPVEQDSSVLPENFQRTPEFINAVNEAVANTIPQLRDAILQSLPSGGEMAPGDRGFAEGLAMAIAQLTDQGVGRVTRVPPEVMRMRAEATQRMKELIYKARKEGKPATYRLRNKVYFAEQLIDPYYLDGGKAQATEIDWPGVPNQAMIPQNATAKAIYAAFEESIGTLAPAHQIPEDPLAITPNGLVVRGAGRGGHHREVGGKKHDVGGEATEHLDPVVIKHKSSQAYQEVRVLGTVAEPARQTV